MAHICEICFALLAASACSLAALISVSISFLSVISIKTNPLQLFPLDHLTLHNHLLKPK
jgi:hypothetical protein